MASHAAARRAVAAGYKDVAVMSDGIEGWADQHQPIRHVSESEADGSSS
jgi:rhodanese-related sulfurtransferase